MPWVFCMLSRWWLWRTGCKWESVLARARDWIAESLWPYWDMAAANMMHWLWFGHGNHLPQPPGHQQHSHGCKPVSCHCWAAPGPDVRRTYHRSFCTAVLTAAIAASCAFQMAVANTGHKAIRLFGSGLWWQVDASDEMIRRALSLNSGLGYRTGDMDWQAMRWSAGSFGV